MNDTLSRPVTAFAGHALLFAGPLLDVALAIKKAGEQNAPEAILVFDDDTGRVIDLDLRGGDADIIGRLTSPTSKAEKEAEAETAPAALPGPRGRGRPKLGVVAREVTLLPRHWEWLAAQAGGASVTLRRLVDEARRGDNGRQQQRIVQETAYRFMSAIAGDLPGYEEACRALFADDNERFRHEIAQWPRDIGAYAAKLAIKDAPQAGPAAIP
jgi:hypothetical protein